MNTGAVINLHSLIDQLEAQVRFRIKLTPQQRQGMITVGDRRISFLDKSHRYAQRHADLLPPYRSIQDFDRVVFDFEELQRVLDRVNTLQEGLNDTLKQIGSNAFAFALVYYDSVGKASEGLAKHFTRINSTEESEKDNEGSAASGNDNGPTLGDKGQDGNSVAA